MNEQKMIKEKPILFSSEMVRAILNGRKTQTRRIMHDVPDWIDDFGYSGFTPEGHISGRGQYADEGPAEKFFKCKYGVKGDRLWVRETWSINDIEFGWKRGITERQMSELLNTNTEIIYRADGEWKDQFPVVDGACPPWRPSIHMPRIVSRIDLEITNVRVERLQDISAKDVIAEGTPDSKDDFKIGGSELYSTHCFKKLWTSINGLDSWDKNPWVWVIEFKKVEENETTFRKS